MSRISTFMATSGFLLSVWGFGLGGLGDVERWGFRVQEFWGVLVFGFLNYEIDLGVALYFGVFVHLLGS